jgi:hypothetical protein
LSLDSRATAAEASCRIPIAIRSNLMRLNNIC